MVISGLFVVFSRSPINSVIALIICFIAMGGQYILLNAQFLAVVHIIVYTGAIMVLFLFVIMLLGAEQIPAEFKWKNVLPAVILGLALVVEVIYLVTQKIAVTGLQLETSVAEAAPASLAKNLFTVYLLPFEITSILLLVAMVGAIVLTKQERKGAQH